MIQMGTLLYASDKTGVVFVQCIKVLGSYKKRIAYMGDVIVVCVKKINPRRFINAKPRWIKRFRKGSIHRSLIIRSKVNFRYLSGALIKFDENSVVLLTGLNVVPVSNKVYGPIFRLFATR
jgi:large subunit ribosomal protein L14